MSGAARRRSFILVLIVSAILLALPGAFGASGSGSVLLGHPGTASFPTLTEYDFWFRASCNPASSVTQGADGYVINLGTDTHVRVKATGATVSPVSFNLSFYGADCGYRPGPRVSNGGSDVYKGADGAKWAVVSLYSGENASFNWWTCSPFGNPPTSCFPPGS